MFTTAQDFDVEAGPLGFTGELLGFAISADGSKIYVGTKEEGLWMAQTSDLKFTKKRQFNVQCLATRGNELWACAPAVDGFVVGVSTDDGANFTTKLPLIGDLTGAIACKANPAGAACGQDANSSQCGGRVRPVLLAEHVRPAARRLPGRRTVGWRHHADDRRRLDHGRRRGAARLLLVPATLRASAAGVRLPWAPASRCWGSRFSGGGGRGDEARLDLVAARRGRRRSGGRGVGLRQRQQQQRADARRGARGHALAGDVRQVPPAALRRVVAEHAREGRRRSGVPRDERARPARDEREAREVLRPVPCAAGAERAPDDGRC